MSKFLEYCRNLFHNVVIDLPLIFMYIMFLSVDLIYGFPLQEYLHFHCRNDINF